MSTLLTLVLIAGSASQLERQNDRVCIYQDIHYQGWEQCYSPGDEVANLRDRRNNISSIRIFGRARVTVFEESIFRGASEEFDSNVPDLGLRIMSGSRSWSDRIDSLKVDWDSRGRPFGRDRPRDNRNRQRDEVCV